MRSPLHKLYAQKMRGLGKGTALWDPSPDVILDFHGVRRRDPIAQVGHLGFYQEGRWRHVLDVHRPYDEQHHVGTIPPELFEQLPRPTVSSQEPVGPTYFTPKSSASFNLQATSSMYGPSARCIQWDADDNLHSSNPRTANLPCISFSLECDASLLHLGCSQSDHVCETELGKYKAYAVRNLKNWTELIRRNEWSIDAHRLSIVTDRTLASSWVNSVQTESGAGAGTGSQVFVDGATGGGLSVSFQYNAATGLVTNYGPVSRLCASVLASSQHQAAAPGPKYAPTHNDDPAIAGPLDQCLFLKRVHAADRSWLCRGHQWSASVPADMELRHRARNVALAPFAVPLTPPRSQEGSSQAAWPGSPSCSSASGNSMLEILEMEAGGESGRADALTGRDEDLVGYALQYILENTPADAAVLHDDDLLPYLDLAKDKEDIFSAWPCLRPEVYMYDYAGVVVGSLKELDFGTPVNSGPAAPATIPAGFASIFDTIDEQTHSSLGPARPQKMSSAVRRKRAVAACVGCRRRHVRCKVSPREDEPCGRCKAMGLACVFRAADLPLPPPPPPPRDIVGRPAVAHRTTMPRFDGAYGNFYSIAARSYDDWALCTASPEDDSMSAQTVGWCPDVGNCPDTLRW
ncbi:hypothetical protein K488DRAFT_72501 [Vararia minispora EC-137]|uniref:Uncharacterized protein n=1 Tax=Vararia minispora EC-137 TaxID=1314806 RepID=A0ACB8QDZ2_9AGAM|nr:hypothetical protein K488DRAFT_72501 [Vararia minispora EC-137]